MRNSPRHGYTLLEVILALALTTVLVGSMLSALYLYERLSTAGQRDVQQARIVRAVIDSIEDDLRAVVYRPVEEETEEDEDEDEGVGAADEETEETTVVEVTDPNEAYESGSVGLVGDAWTLVVHTNQPDRDGSVDVTFADLLAEGSRTSDLRSVSYFLAVPGAPGLAGAVADRLLQTSAQPFAAIDGEPLGLVRLEGDRLAMTLADQTGDYDALAAGARLVAPEVKTLSFRYFDGENWRLDWDAVGFERLPRAVEATIGLRIETEANAEEARANDATADLPNLFEVRHVFALPQADPTPPEEVLP